MLNIGRGKTCLVTILPVYIIQEDAKVSSFWLFKRNKGMGSGTVVFGMNFSAQTFAAPTFSALVYFTTDSFDIKSSSIFPHNSLNLLSFFLSYRIISSTDSLLLYHWFPRLIASDFANMNRLQGHIKVGHWRQPRAHKHQLSFFLLNYCYCYPTAIAMLITVRNDASTVPIRLLVWNYAHLTTTAPSTMPKPAMFSDNQNQYYAYAEYAYRYRSEMEPVRIFSTRPVNFKIIAGWPAGRPVFDRPGQPVFCRRFLFTVQCI